MQKECIFKAQRGSGIWYLYRIPNENVPGGNVFRIYYGRKWFDHVTWYGEQMALSTLLEYCWGYLFDITKGQEQ